VNKQDTATWLRLFINNAETFGAPLDSLLQRFEGEAFFDQKLGRVEDSAMHDMKCPSCGSDTFAETADHWRRDATGSSLRITQDTAHMGQANPTVGTRTAMGHLTCFASACDFSKPFKSCYEELARTVKPAAFYEFFSTADGYYNRPAKRKFYAAHVDGGPVFYGLSCYGTVALLNDGLGGGAGTHVNLATVQAFDANDASNQIESTDWKRVKLGANRLPTVGWETGEPMPYERKLVDELEHQQRTEVDRDIEAQVNAFRSNLKAKSALR